MFHDASHLEKQYLEHLDSMHFKGYGRNLFATDQARFYRGMRDYLVGEVMKEL